MKVIEIGGLGAVGNVDRRGSGARATSVPPQPSSQRLRLLELDKQRSATDNVISASTDQDERHLMYRWAMSPNVGPIRLMRPLAGYDHTIRYNTFL